ncbi:MAG: hypothetical protein JWP57_2603, partial [Spirosoma sp.]|nr:hypothetical protein [Spirosoma sp.]
LTVGRISDTIRLPVRTAEVLITTTIVPAATGVRALQRKHLHIIVAILQGITTLALVKTAVAAPTHLVMAVKAAVDGVAIINQAIANPAISSHPTKVRAVVTTASRRNRLTVHRPRVLLHQAVAVTLAGATHGGHAKTRY